MASTESVLTLQPPASNASEVDQAQKANLGDSSPDKIDSNTTFGTLSAFRDKAPEMYNKMLERMAMSICHKLRKQKSRH